ncbi:F0F1 ATP synthase subunit epsilon [Oricola cellulosilytica]|uniref:ATP synthase epsilon chain n=1 Tax=Oricola cellulosilytica TaxID=1429082 RepID=A0A4V2MNP2_9HYPH|nr:F0F1 ATP synthase subunit epsilon [Oricola cellulosilytica]TCD13796.1 F0F1 ATP synthase subunit epsilon [Oricola cellulosilytica]
MADAFKFELVSPERLLVSEEALQVVVPGEEGYFTVLASHAPAMATLKPGVVEVKLAGGADERFVVFGGFVDVTPEACTLLAESAVNVNDIDRHDLEQRIQDAREDVDDAKDDAGLTKARTYLDQLTTLQGAILPA